MEFDAQNAECLVFTFKDGLLSRVGHDLKLRVERFSGSLTEHSVTATFDPRSVRVVAAVRGGKDDVSALSPKECQQVVDNIERAILQPSRFPEIRFLSTQLTREGNALRVRGTLDLHGVSKEIAVTARRVDGRWLAEVDLHQPDFGIEPFSALLGTLRVKAQIRVRISIPA